MSSSTYSGVLTNKNTNGLPFIQPSSGLYVRLINTDTQETVASLNPTDGNGYYETPRPSTGTYGVWVCQTIDGTFVFTGEQIDVFNTESLAVIGGGGSGGPDPTAVHLAGTETITGIKSFAADTYYGSGRPYVDVCQKGADSTGNASTATATTTAIRNAISSAGTLSSLLGTPVVVRIPFGVFYVAGSGTLFSVPNNVTVEGIGYGSVIRVVSGNGNFQALFAAASATPANITFRNFRIDTNGSNNTGATVSATNGQEQLAIVLTACVGCTISHVYFDTVSGIQTVLMNGSGCDQNVIEHCYVRFVMNPAPQPDYDNTAFYITGTNKRISNNRLVSPVTSGYGARTCMELIGGPATATGNVVDGFYTLAIVDSDPNSTGPISVVGNSGRNLNYGITVWTFSGGASPLNDVSITGNTLQIAQSKHGLATCSGIAIVDSGVVSSPIIGLTIANNVVQFTDINQGQTFSNPGDCAGIAIKCQSSNLQGLTVTGNTVIDAPVYGYLFEQSTTGETWSALTVCNNTAIRPGQNTTTSTRTGFQFRFNLTNSLLNGLIFTGNTVYDDASPSVTSNGFMFTGTAGTNYKNVVLNNNQSISINGTITNNIVAVQGSGGPGQLLNNALYAQSLTPSAVAANTLAEQTFTVPGLISGQVVTVAAPASMPAGLGMVAARVSAANTLALMFFNSTSGSLTPPSGTYRFLAT